MRRLFLVFVLLAAAARGESVWLSHLDLSAVEQGWGTAQVDRSVVKLPLQIGGRAFTNGIGTHAPSRMIVRLDGRAERFTAQVGLNDAGRREPGTVEFIVSGERGELWRSGRMTGGGAPRRVDVPLAGVRTLTLAVTDAGDDYNSDHADWAEARIDYAGRRPALSRGGEAEVDASLYPPADRLAASPGRTAYFVDPARGDDTHDGRSAATAWQSFALVNGLRLAAGDRVVVAPGTHRATLRPAARGTAAAPVVFEFQPGVHRFPSDEALRVARFVSNSADAPLKPRPVGFLISDCAHVSMQGNPGTEIHFAGERMTMFVAERSEYVTWSNLVFDFERPTVSEFRVEEAGTNHVVIRPAEGSSWKIEQGRFAWTGDLGPGWTMVQQADPVLKSCWRMGRWDPFAQARAEDIGGGRVALTYAGAQPGMAAGRQYQFRNVDRDTTSAVNDRCRNVRIVDCAFHALPGMGLVSQFTDGITYQRVRVAPRAGTIRTCAAWADCFHFSGCRGEIRVEECVFSGTQDDPINVHGTHLRLIEKAGARQVLLRFMQPQTYGIPAFVPGDRVEFVDHATLRSYATNTVAGLERRSDKEWLLTLAADAADFGPNDVVDNVSWYPDVTIRNCTVDTDSCRGFLITTRGRALVEGCTFTRTAMSAILCEDDAEGWFESGPLRDLTIRSNRFVQCANPVVHLNPQTHSSKPDEWVHANVRIEDNIFEGGGISAHHVRGLDVAGNRFTGSPLPLSLSLCTDVRVTNNVVGIKSP